MAKTAELEQALGKAQIQAAKEVVKEQMRDESAALVEKKKEVDDLLSQAIAAGGIPVNIAVYRKASANTHIAPSFLGLIENLTAEGLRQTGVEQVVKEWSGGGYYKCIVSAPGLNITKETFFDIEGDPLPPYPDRMARALNPPQQQGVFGQQMRPQIPGMNPWPNFGFGGGMGALAQASGQQFIPPGYAMVQGPMGPTLVPFPNQQADAKPNEEVRAIAMAMKERADKQDEMMRRMDEDRRQRDIEARHEAEKRDLERRLADATKDSETKLAEERRRNEEAQRRQDEKIALLSAPKENPTLKILEVLAPTIATMAPKLMDRGPEGMKMVAEMFGQMAKVQQSSSDQNIAVLTKAMDRPGPEDRLDKMAGIVANTYGAVGNLMQQTLAAQGGGLDNPWAKVAETAITAAGNVAVAVLGGGMEEVDENGNPIEQQEQEPQRVGPSQVTGRTEDRPRRPRLAPPPGMIPDQQQQDAQEAQPQQQEPDMDPERQAVVNTIHIKNFDSAMGTIIELICKNGNPALVAWRLWKHSTSNVPIATEWFNHPEQGTELALTSLRYHGEITVTDERIGEIASAIREFYDHLQTGGTPQQFLMRHGLSEKEAEKMMPRKIKKQPVQGAMSTSGANDATFGEATQTQPQTGQVTALRVVSDGPQDDTPAETPMGVKPPPRAEQAAPPPGDDARLAAMSTKAREAAGRGMQPAGPTEYLPAPPPPAKPAAGPAAPVAPPPEAIPVANTDKPVEP